MKRKVTTYDYACLNEARDILIRIDMPDNLVNPRSVMTLAALAEIGPNKKWRNASEGYHGTHYVVNFINENFPNKAGLDTKPYAENSRETFRKQNIKPWISAGILEPKAGLATNDRDNSYRFTSYFAALIRSYGTDMWEEKLKDYKETHLTYAEYLKQMKDIERDYIAEYEGNCISLKKSAHNKLQVKILQELIPLVCKEKPELLYIGDATDRNLWQKDERMEELGINVLSQSGNMPDIILYDKSEKRIIFIEAYHSTGPFTIDRVNALKALCNCEKGTEAAFITAFDSTSKMLKNYKSIAWDTDIWSADEPTHLVHKNGDKFIGRPL